jgi:hypothetical protein
MVTLIVMEPGSEWPGHVGDPENVVAVGGDEDGLLDRAKQRLDAIRRRGQRVRVAVLACRETLDATSVDRRSEVARELLAAVAEAGFGRLVMTTSKRATMRERCELLALAGDLSQRLRGSTATVSVRFGSDSLRGVGLADGVGADVFTHALRTPAFAE